MTTATTGDRGAGRTLAALRLRRGALALAAPLLALVFSLVVGGVVLQLSHVHVFTAYHAMLDYGFQGGSLANIVTKATAYFFGGLAVAIGFRMSLFNIGVEGQYRLAALLASAAGASLHVWAPLDVVLVVLVAMGTGAGVAGVAGVLKATRGVSEVISTIMINFIALAILDLLISGPLRIPIAGQNIRAAGTVRPAGRVPALDRVLGDIGLHVPSGSTVTGLVVLAIVLGVGYTLLLGRTRYGFSLRATGMNPFAARAAGVGEKSMIVKTMLISGAIGGLTGLPFLLSQYPFRYDDAFVTGLGLTSIGIALLGRNNPVGIALGALLFAFLDQTAPQVQLVSTNAPDDISTIIEGIVVLAVVIAYEIVRRYGLRSAERATARAARRTDAPAAEAPAEEVTA